MRTLLLIVFVALGLPAGGCAAEPMSIHTAPSARIDTPPSATKLRLIRQFMEVIGLQQKLDTGSFLERYAVPGGPMWPATSGAPLSEGMSGFKVRIDALKAAYARRRSKYQQAYEDHLNWEFTEAELAEIVAFLSKPVGQHYLDGRWRMEAYTDTNTEDMEQEIVNEATASLKN